MLKKGTVCIRTAIYCYLLQLNVSCELHFEYADCTFILILCHICHTFTKDMILCSWNFQSHNMLHELLANLLLMFIRSVINAGLLRI